MQTETIQAIVKSWRPRARVERRKVARDKYERRESWAIVDAAICIVERNTFFSEPEKDRIIKELHMLKD
jgi:hypothetical protein